MTRKITRLLLATLAASLFAPAQAAAPNVKGHAPAYVRMMIGDIEVVAINDGTMNLPANEVLKGMTPSEIDAELAKSFLKSPLETSHNAFLVNTGSKLVLIDTGAGGLGGPTLGKFFDNLKAAGYTPAQVDEIYITHMHGDHVGGLVVDGKMVFPNAIVRAQQREAAFWTSEENMNKAAPERRGTYKNAMNMLNPYIGAGKFKSFEGDVELAPGVRALSGKGHTPGHASYVVESKGRKLVLIGDLIHVGAVQFSHPELTIRYDVDFPAAVAERRQSFDAAAREGSLIGASHLPFPGIGHVRKNGKGYDYLPMHFSRAQ